MSILLVDESMDSVLSIKSALASAGYSDIALARSTEEALHQLDLNGAGRIMGINLVLISLDGLDINPLAVCKAVRSMEHYRDTPVIALVPSNYEGGLQSLLEAGITDYVLKPVEAGELQLRIRLALRLKWETELRKSYELKIYELNRQLEQAEHMLRQYSSKDVLTGLYNRYYFEEGLDREWRRAVREGRPLSLLLIDIDDFRIYNEKYGADVGDEALKKVARCIQSELKRPGDLVARWGDDQFAVMLSDTDSLGATVVGEMLRTKINSMKLPHEFSQVSSYLTVSAGVATIVPDRTSSPSSIIGACLNALNTAKQEGKNRVKSMGT